MTDSKSADPLLEWNRLNRENAEQGFVSALYQSMAETTPVVDKFSLWLLAGTGATGALMITQIDSVLPHLSPQGFKTCLVIIVTSAVCGFIAKYFAIRCEIQNLTQSKLSGLVKPIFEKHEAEEQKILTYAEKRGIDLQSEIDLSVVITEFSRPFPWWVKLLISRRMKKVAGDRQAGHHIAILAYMSQIRWASIQATLFLIFMLAAAFYASGI